MSDLAVFPIGEKLSEVATEPVLSAIITKTDDFLRNLKLISIIEAIALYYLDLLPVLFSNLATERIFQNLM